MKIGNERSIPVAARNLSWILNNTKLIPTTDTKSSLKHRPHTAELSSLGCSSKLVRILVAISDFQRTFWVRGHWSFFDEVWVGTDHDAIFDTDRGLGGSVEVKCPMKAVLTDWQKLIRKWKGRYIHNCASDRAKPNTKRLTDLVACLSDASVKSPHAMCKLKWHADAG